VEHRGTNHRLQAVSAVRQKVSMLGTVVLLICALAVEFELKPGEFHNFDVLGDDNLIFSKF
jgi:hypothetical protein